MWISPGHATVVHHGGVAADDGFDDDVSRACCFDTFPAKIWCRISIDQARRAVTPTITLEHLKTILGAQVMGHIHTHEFAGSSTEDCVLRPTNSGIAK